MAANTGPQYMAEVPLHLSDDGWVEPIRVDALLWDISVKVSEVDGVPQITGLKLEPRATMPWTAPDGTKMTTVLPESAVVTSERLRHLPLRFLARTAAEVSGGAATQESLQAIFDAERPEKRQQGRERPDAHYEEVATVYTNALRAGRPPTKAVGERWGVERAMASRYVAEARKRGLLGYPTRQGVAGTTSDTSPHPTSKKKGS